MQHLGGCEIRGRHDALASLFLSAAETESIRTLWMD
jgi:hypothetical protein